MTRYILILACLLIGKSEVKASFSTNWYKANIRTSAKSLFILTNSVTVTNVTAETSIIKGAINGIGITNIPANYFVPGKKLIIKASGVSSSPAVPGTLTIKIKGGSTVILTTGAITSIVSAANKGWTMEASIYCRTSGANGLFVGTGVVFRSDQTTLTTFYWPMTNFPAETVTLNTTTAIPFDITAQFSTASGSSITVQTLEVLQFN